MTRSALETNELRSLNARLGALEGELAQTSDRVKLLVALQDSFARIALTRDADDIVATMLRAAREPLGFSRAIYFSIDRTSGLQARLQLDGNDTVETSSEVIDTREGGAIVSLLRSGRTESTGDSGELCAPLVDVRNWYAIATLSRNDGAFGLLYVDGHRSRIQRPFETTLIRTLATIAAIAIDNGVLLRKTEELAMRDPLTGLYNRRAFSERLAIEIERCQAEGGLLTYVLIDVDDFKHINDRHGHAHGDAVLRKLGDVLTRSSRSVDVVGRYAGDEFVVLLSNVDRQLARVLVARISADLRAQDLHCSVGAALYPDDGTNGATLLAAADRALYRTKACGKNGFSFHSETPAE